MSSNSQHPSSETQPPSDIDLAALAALLDSTSTHSDDRADENLGQLFQQLERADEVMQGMEGRVDSLSKRLDELLHALEPDVLERYEENEGNSVTQSEVNDPCPQQPSK